MGNFSTENPATLEPLKTYAYLSEAELENRLERAFLRQKSWRLESPSLKAEAFRRFAQALRSRKEDFALSMALEMGKPVADGRSEVEKCAITSEYYADQAEAFTQAETVLVEGREQHLVYEPLGVIMAVMPWNFPLWQVVRSFLPIALAGNAYLLKHSDQVAGTAELLEQVIISAFGEDIFFNLWIDHDQVAKLIHDRRVRGVTMTGSSRGGSQVAAVAGQALKKCLLELGGSDPVLVLPGADLDLAAKLSAQSRLINNGQSCISAKRFLVPDRDQDLFVHKMSEHLSAVRIGDPRDEKTQLGPLAHRKFKEKMNQQLEQIQKEGAKRLWRREGLDLRTSFVAPQILEASPAQSSYSKEEFFAPVALVTSYRDEDEMLELANSTIYGLGATVIGSDLEEAERVARQVESGVVALNRIVQSDARLPFGGVKDSGFGRELSLQGVREFQSLKAILR